MAKIQTRRSLSINGKLYAQLKAYVEAHPELDSTSNFVEGLICHAMGVERPNVDYRGARARRKAAEERHAPINKMTATQVAAVLARPASAIASPRRRIFKPKPVTIDDVISPCRRENCRIQEIHEAHD